MTPLDSLRRLGSVNVSAAAGSLPAFFMFDNAQQQAIAYGLCALMAAGVQLGLALTAESRARRAEIELATRIRAKKLSLRPKDETDETERAERVRRRLRTLPPFDDDSDSDNFPDPEPR